MSNTFRYRDRDGTVYEKYLTRLGSFRDQNNVESVLYRGGVACFLNRRGGADPVEDSYVEQLGLADGARWLADHGLDVPRDMWDYLQGRYEFDAGGKPIIPEIKEKRIWHSDDFTSVIWFDVEYHFTKGLQAECVRVLYEAWQSRKGSNKTVSLSEATIGDKAKSSNVRFRLEHVFKPYNKGTHKRQAHPAWDTMIKSVGKGMFALIPP
jgi:hypothetical protein